MVNIFISLLVQQASRYLIVARYISDVPVWSKLETGRIPQPMELFQIIDFHLDMQFSEMDVGKIKFQT